MFFVWWDRVIIIPNKKQYLESKPRWWEASTLITAFSLLPGQFERKSSRVGAYFVKTSVIVFLAHAAWY